MDGSMARDSGGSDDDIHDYDDWEGSCRVCAYWNTSSGSVKRENRALGKANPLYRLAGISFVLFLDEK